MRGSKKRWGTRSCRRRRDSTEWVRLYRGVDSEVRSWFAARVASEQDVDDLVGEVLAKLTQNDRPDDLKAYMATASANALADYRRRKVRERQFLQRPFEAVSHADGIPGSVPDELSEDDESSEKLAGVERIVNSLPRKQAQLLHLRFLEGLRMAEVARRVGCSQDVAYKRLQWVIQRLRDRYRVEPSNSADDNDAVNS